MLPLDIDYCIYLLLAPIILESDARNAQAFLLVYGILRGSKWLGQRDTTVCIDLHLHLSVLRRLNQRRVVPVVLLTKLRTP